jgi:hypothetical protein
MVVCSVLVNDGEFPDSEVEEFSGQGGPSCQSARPRRAFTPGVPSRCPTCRASSVASAACQCHLGPARKENTGRYMTV